jgi:hypothetical protein
LKTLQDYIDIDMIDWLQDNNLKYKKANIILDKGALNIFFNDHFCIKIYDRLGHGYSVNINVADKFDESIYDNDSFNLTWAFRYFNITQTASFGDRGKDQYLKNLPNLINDLKNIIPRLNKMNSIEWKKMKEWITAEARKQFP